MQLPQLLKGAQLEERKCDEKSAAGGEHQYALRSAGSALPCLQSEVFGQSLPAARVRNRERECKQDQNSRGNEIPGRVIL